MNNKKHPIAVAEGDGIGPEIMKATLKILKASGAPLEIHPVEIGEKVYQRGEKAGIAPETWDVLRKTKAFLKAPITTPQGGGFKSLNVTVRTTLGLFANIRPCVAYAPFVSTNHPGMNVIIVRENEEDLYTGIEYRPTDDVVQALKIISRTGSEKIIRYAFEYARQHSRKKVTCFSKDNILKMTDGLFHKIFLEIAKDYPDLEHEHWIVDIGAAKLADKPELFDVLVLPNLYGDILSDVAAEIAGSVGIAGSANIGDHGAMFEAIHGSAPRRAGQNKANPSGLLLAAVQMLQYLGESDAAATIENAWLRTIEDGIHTYDIFNSSVSKEQVGTQEFADEVIKRLGSKPQTLPEASHTKSTIKLPKPKRKLAAEKKLVGVDIFIDWTKDLDLLVTELELAITEPFKLKMIANRGVKVWPNPQPETSMVDQFRCRFMVAKETTRAEILDLLKAISERGLPFVQMELLTVYDGSLGFTASQDEQ